MLKSWINRIKRILPCEEFWIRFIKKFLGFFVSLKIYILVTATILLLEGFIQATHWVTVITSIALGRVLVQSVLAKKETNGK